MQTTRWIIKHIFSFLTKYIFPKRIPKNDYLQSFLEINTSIEMSSACKDDLSSESLQSSEKEEEKPKKNKPGSRPSVFYENPIYFVLYYDIINANTGDHIFGQYFEYIYFNRAIFSEEEERKETERMNDFFMKRYQEEIVYCTLFNAIKRKLHWYFRCENTQYEYSITANKHWAHIICFGEITKDQIYEMSCKSQELCVYLPLGVRGIKKFLLKLKGIKFLDTDDI